MSEWVNIRLESLMFDTNLTGGGRLDGFASYLARIIENQEVIIELLKRDKQ